jgi:hypothetical protein
MKKMQANDDKTLIREANVVNDQFFSLVEAAPDRLQTRPIKSREEVFPGRI